MIRAIITPNNTKLSINIPKNYVGKKIELLYYALDELQTKDSLSASPAISGNVLNNQAFKNWIEQAESMPTTNLKEAKTKWVQKRKQLQQLIK